MPFRKISRDLKLAAIRLYDRDCMELPDILDCMRMSERTFYRILKLWRETGDVVKHTYGLRGRPRLLKFDDIDYLKRVIAHRPSWFLDELQNLLQTNRFISVHFTTIHRELQRARMPLKKLKKIAAERNENLRADFIRRMAQYQPEQLGFIDEASKDERTRARSRGRSPSGTRAVEKTLFVRGRRFTVEGLLTLQGIAANTVIEGAMTRERFMQFLEHNVMMPLCSPFPGPLSVLVMDNAIIHHGIEITALADRYGVRIEYLPPYSPDLNPIKEAFSKIKAFIRRHGHLMATTGDGMIFELMMIVDIITASDAMGYFIHGGYF